MSTKKGLVANSQKIFIFFPNLVSTFDAFSHYMYIEVIKKLLLNL